MRALFSFPLHAGGVRFGALDLYRLTPGDLHDTQLADAVLLTALAAQAVVTQQAPARLDAGVNAPDQGRAAAPAPRLGWATP